MATLDNAAIVREAHKAWNEKDMTRYASYATADCKVTNVAFGLKLPFREYGQIWATAFPDGQIELVNIVAQGDLVMTEFTGRGTHTGVLRTPTGEIAPTGRKVEMSFVETYRLRNGKITEGKLYFDSATMLSQLGLSMPQAATAERTTESKTQPRH